MKFRDGTNDAFEVLKDVEEYALLDIQPADIVLDIGGHIGLFALEAYARGAEHVISVEPEPDNCRMHRLNLASKHHRHILIQAAAIGSHEMRTRFYVNPGRNKARHSILEEPGYATLEVAAFNFTQLLGMYEPHVLKVDCEGAEYDFDWSLPPQVRSLAIEFHRLPERSAEQQAILDVLDVDFEQVYVTPESRSFMLHIWKRR